MTYLSRIHIFIKIRVRIIEKYEGSRFEKDETHPGYDASKTSHYSKFLVKDFSSPNLPIWIKFGSAVENVMLETHTNFGGKRLSKFHEIMVGPKRLGTRCIRYPGCSGFVQNLSLFEFLKKDCWKPSHPIWEKIGSAIGNVMLETHWNFGGNRFSKLQEIMVRSAWYQMTNVHPKSAWP